MQAVQIDAKQRAALGFRPFTSKAPVPKKETTLNRRQAAEEKEVVEKPVVTAVPIAAVPQTKKPRVAAYCRVSTMMDSQETSIEGQRAHYEEVIRGNDEWEFAGIFLETGVTGTKTEVRPELQRLLAECRAGHIDIILTKSISRFARNTTDCLEMVRTLTGMGITLRFEKERIDTGTMDSEFMLSILACFAEDESHSISGNMKWGIRKRFQNGTYKQAIAPYGYEWTEGKLAIVPDQAEVVKLIFHMALSGSGGKIVAERLNEKKLPSPTGSRWNQNTIRQMIRNPAYIGDCLYQKTFMDEQFRQRRNQGELDQYYDEEHHDAIISKEDFEKANAVMDQRAKEVGYRGNEKRSRSTNHYAFSSMLTCKCCGTVLYRQVRAGGTVTWVCQKHATHPDLCQMTPQDDEDLKRAFINCLNKLSWSQGRKDGILDTYERLLGKTEAEKNAERLAEIEALLEENRKETRKLNAIIMRDHFLPEHRETQARLSTAARELMAEKNSILINGVPAGTIQELKGFISGWRITGDAGAFPEEEFTTFVERCTVLAGKMVTFHFRCGLKLTESLSRTLLEED